MLEIALTSSTNQVYLLTTTLDAFVAALVVIATTVELLRPP